MRDDDVLHALLERRVDDGEGVVPREMRRREHQAVPRDRAQHLARRGQELAVGVGHVHRLDAEPE